MKPPLRLLLPLALALCGASAHGQNLYFDFNKIDTFTHGFTQNQSGIALSWSATGGVDDNNGAAGGVVSTGAGKVTVEHNGSPAFSFNDGLAYTVSEYVQVNSIGASGDVLLGLALGNKALLTTGAPGIGFALTDADGVHLAMEVMWRDPAKNASPPVQLSSPVPTGDWLKVALYLQETDVTTGEFTYTYEVIDFGPTGVGAPSYLLTQAGSFTDAALAGKVAAGWVPIWETTVVGNPFDNLAAGISTGPVTSKIFAATGDSAPGIPNAVFSVVGDPAFSDNGNLAFQALVTGTSKTSGITAANNSGIWLFTAPGQGSLIAQTGAAAPGLTNGTFTKLTDPLLSKSALGFYAKAAAVVDKKTEASAGVWAQNGGALNLVVGTGAAAPGFIQTPPPVITAISQFGLNEDGYAPIIGTAVGKGVNEKVFWIPNSNGDLQIAAQAFEDFQVWAPQAHVAGQSRSVDPVNGYATAILKEHDGTIVGLATPGASAISRTAVIPPVNGKVPAPGVTGASVQAFGLPAVDADGTVAFSFTMEGAGVKPTNNAGIATVTTSGTATLLVRTGSTAAAGTSGALYSALSAPALAKSFSYGDTIAFIGSLVPGVGDTAKDGANAQGIWSNGAGSMQLLARKGDIAPGGGLFSSFNQVVLTDGETMIFQATISGAPASTNQGIWYGWGNSVYVVARSGALVPVGNTMKTIKSLKIFPISPYCMGQSRSFSHTSGDFAYTAVFTDGTWAIYVLQFV